MMDIKTLELNITNNRTNFLKGLKAAGYVARVVNEYAFNDGELLRLAIEIYDDIWGAFNKAAFEAAIA